MVEGSNTSGMLLEVKRTGNKVNLIAFTWFIFASVLVPFTETTVNVECSVQPKLSLITPVLELNVANVAYNETTREIFAPRKTKLKLECLSSSPIDFDFHGYLVNSLVSVDTSRIVRNVKEECYSIIVEVETNREATGNYKCWNVGDEPNGQASLYVYANGEVPPYLIYGDSNEEIQVLAKPGAKEAILPCATTNPKISVALYKVEREGFRLLSLGPHIIFDSKIGFKIDLMKSPETFGKYKCIAKNSSHYDVIVHLKEEEESTASSSSNSDTKSVQLSTIEVTKTQSIFACNGVELISTPNCDTTIQCRLAKRCLNGESKCGHSSCTCFNAGSTCSKSLRSKYMNNLKINDGCQAIDKNRNGGFVQCHSPGKDTQASIEYFVGLDESIVQNWRAASVDKLLRVSSARSADFYFVGEEIRFSCTGVKFLLSSGFQWKLLLENDTMISANISESVTRRTNDMVQETAKLKISHPKIKRVVCLAPMWNETTWLKASALVVVKDTVAPEFLDPQNVTVKFYETEKNGSLLCTAKGYPAPDIMWLRGDEEYVENVLFDGSVSNVTSSEIVFPEVTELDHDIIYTCNASNPRGNIFKTYTIYVSAHPSKMVFTFVGIGMFICFGVVMFVSIMVLKLKQKRKQSSLLIYFSDFDMEEFKNGNANASKTASNACEKAMYMPYNTAFEIEEEDLTIEYDSILGQGEFGVVLKGRVKVANKEGDIDEERSVAVKTTRNSEMSGLRAILSELKILMFIGKHKNVIQLVGAVTRNILDKKVYVVVEYCALGNMETYLKQHRTSFLDEFDASANVPSDTPAISPGYVRIDYLLRTSDLIKWAYDVANGMEFLASKKIIHGDLAIRNLLLDADQNVKITDFGLSKQMYKYMNNYIVKKKDTPLPWRWLAIETLKDYDLSTPSDVWSYGVVLWELFSLAETPYAGLNFNAEFLRLLMNGYRLDKPGHSNSEIYSIMRECWRQAPSHRPTFTNLRQSMAQMLPPGSVDDEPDKETDILIQNDKNQAKEDYYFSGNESQSLNV